MVKVINFERKTDNHDSQLNKCKIRFFVIEGNLLASIWQNNSRLFPSNVPAYKYRRYTIVILRISQLHSSTIEYNLYVNFETGVDRKQKITFLKWLTQKLRCSHQVFLRFFHVRVSIFGNIFFPVFHKRRENRFCTESSKKQNVSTFTRNLSRRPWENPMTRRFHYADSTLFNGFVASQGVFDEGKDGRYSTVNMIVFSASTKIL